MKANLNRKDSAQSINTMEVGRLLGLTQQQIIFFELLLAP